MGQQQSKKRGLRSESQKEEKARDAYAPIPPSNPVKGAFGDENTEPDSTTRAQNRKRTESGRSS